MGVEKPQNHCNYWIFLCCRKYTIGAHIRDLGTPEWCRRENGQQYAGALRRGLHPPHLHPRHPADAESGGGDNGKFYGAGYVRRTPSKKPGRKTRFPVWHSLSFSGHFAVWVTVWVRPVDPHFDPHKISQNFNENSRNHRISGVFWSCWADSNRRPHPYQMS